MENKDMYLFKNEIYSKLREIENRFFSELNNKNLEININLKTFNEKVNSILESNKSMIDSIAAQKLNLEKINQFESDKKIMNDVITSQKIKINNILSEIDKMKLRYNKMLSENIIIPGYVGPGCNFKTLGEYIISSIKDIKKLKEEKNQIKKEEKEVKTRVELMINNMTCMLEYNSNKIREFEKKKNFEIETLLENKIQNFNLKMFENNSKIEDKINEITLEIEKINNSKINIETVTNNKFEEINKKEKEMKEKIFLTLKEIEEIKKMKKELNGQIKEIYSKIDDISKNKDIKQQQNKINIGNINNNNILDNNSKYFNTIAKNSIDNILLQNSTFNKNKVDKSIILSNIKGSKNEINHKILSSKKNLKINNYIKVYNKEIETKNEPILINSYNKNILLNSENKIREKKFQKSLNTNSNYEKKIFLTNNKEININIIKENINNDPNLNLVNYNFNKKINEKMLSIHDTEDLKNTKNNHQLKSKKNIKYFTNTNEKNSIIIYKNNKKLSRNINIVDCNLVNLNLLDIPNINDIKDYNSNSYPKNDYLYKMSLKKRKIRSVDSSRSNIYKLKLDDKKNIYFNSSNDFYKLKK